MEENKECLECGSKDHLFELKSGYFVCKDCMNKLGKEQRRIQKDIMNYLSENFQISTPYQQATALEGIAMNIKFENGLLSEEQADEILKMTKRMEKAFE